ncbi:MAG TPA: hypothetical protein PK020_01415 [Ilumatobacteraceae bacterium]|nr:hypothetical protein [Ilumatobacteraceae bacterium]
MTVSTKQPASLVMPSLVAELLKVEADLVVTITAPLDRRRPNNDQDRIRLRNLFTDARSQVREAAREEVATAILRRLDAALAGVDMSGGAHGVIIVATAEWSDTHLLSFPVRSAVALGPTPATRFLVQGLRRSPRYRLLVISDRATRLFEAVRDELTEVTDHGFPFTADIVPRDLRAIAGRFAQPTGRDDKEQWRNFYRSVDLAVTQAGRGDELPLVIAGVKRSTSLYEKVSRNAHLVIGRIDGAHDHSSAHELGQAAWPILRDHLKARRGEAVRRLSEAFHSDHAVVGLDDAWRAMRQGRGHLLVVEEDYRGTPVREDAGRLVPADDLGPNVLSDPVDELIEHVVRAGGAVEFVAADALADIGRIGLILR